MTGINHPPDDRPTDAEMNDVLQALQKIWLRLTPEQRRLASELLVSFDDSLNAPQRIDLPEPGE